MTEEEKRYKVRMTAEAEAGIDDLSEEERAVIYDFLFDTLATRKIDSMGGEAYIERDEEGNIRVVDRPISPEEYEVALANEVPWALAVKRYMDEKRDRDG